MPELDSLAGTIRPSLNRINLRENLAFGVNRRL